MGLVRTLAAATSDATCDFTIDYVAHDIKIQIGRKGESDAGFVQFSETVDFNAFVAVEGALGMAASSTLLATLAGILAISF